MHPIKSCFIVFLLAGCAGEESMRHLAGSSAAVLNEYRRELKGFADRQTALNADVDRGIRDFGELQSMRDTAVEQRLSALRMAGDKPALDAYALLTARSGTDLLSQSSLLRPAQPVPASPAITFDASTLERLTNQLNGLGRQRSFWDELLRAVAYRTELQETYRASLENASNSTSLASEETAQAVANVTSRGD